MATPRPHQRLGDAAWSKMPKVNGELFALTYGSLVTQLIKDFEDLKVVNQQLDKMGYNIGVRLVDEFLAKSGVASCQDFRDTAEVVAKVAFKMFLGINVEVSQWNAEGTAVCGAAAECVRGLVVLERAVRRAARRAGDGADASGGAVRQGCAAGR
ncbi:hypothetical protein ON010_g2402 [Phytophthora cinnamomi]|nr:hypothetical protein ON010_g2402 [Phytophthora cinnamomi]